MTFFGVAIQQWVPSQSYTHALHWFYIGDSSGDASGSTHAGDANCKESETPYFSYDSYVFYSKNRRGDYTGSKNHARVRSARSTYYCGIQQIIPLLHSSWVIHNDPVIWGGGEGYRSGSLLHCWNSLVKIPAWNGTWHQEVGKIRHKGAVQNRTPFRQLAQDVGL